MTGKKTLPLLGTIGTAKAFGMSAATLRQAVKDNQISAPVKIDRGSSDLTELHAFARQREATK
jgi:hypothetical protein